MPKELMSPNLVSLITAILRHSLTDGFVRAKFGTFESLRFAKNAQDKDPLVQMLWNDGPHIIRPIFVTIEINQQNHESLGILFHFSDVI